MRYVALLRGINVGGKNKIPMKDLRDALLEDGYTEVASYIASGNIVLTSSDSTEEVRRRFERLLLERFGIETRVLVIPAERFTAIAEEIPPEWSNDDRLSSDVLFLFPEDDSPEVLDRVPPREGIDQAFYVPGALLWSVSRDLQSKTGLRKIMQTTIYKNLTVRNVNTVRKLLSML